MYSVKPWHVSFPQTCVELEVLCNFLSVLKVTASRCLIKLQVWGCSSARYACWMLDDAGWCHQPCISRWSRICVTAACHRCQDSSFNICSSEKISMHHVERCTLKQVSDCDYLWMVYTEKNVQHVKQNIKRERIKKSNTYLSSNCNWIF